MTLALYILLLFATIVILGVAAYSNGHINRPVVGIVSIGGLASCIGLITFSFFQHGVAVGLGLIVATVAFVPLSRGISSKIAQRILGYKTGLGDNHARFASDYDRAARGTLDMSAVMNRMDVHDHKVKERLATIASKPHISEVLTKNNIAFDMYAEMYWEIRGLGMADLTLEILSDDNLLQKYIDLKNTNATKSDFRKTFRNYQ